MKILITGGTGFVGQYVIHELIKQEHEIIVVAVDKKKAKQFEWYNQVQFIYHDIHKSKMDLNNFGNPKTVIHLAWMGLPNYQSLHHIEENLPAQRRFLQMLVDQGVEQVLVTGTCLEFGKQNGPLAENMPTFPDVPYAVAKDELRKWLQTLEAEKGFTMQWVRLFYIYGKGQNPNSILSQLDRAIDNKETIFNMSGGEQLRDYLPIEKVAKILVSIVNQPEKHGILHCCSGEPISIKRLVEEHIKKRNSKIKLNLGYYPYLKYEPMAFWGENNFLN